MLYSVISVRLSTALCLLIGCRNYSIIISVQTMLNWRSHTLISGRTLPGSSDRRSLVGNSTSKHWHSTGIIDWANSIIFYNYHIVSCYLLKPSLLRRLEGQKEEHNKELIEDEDQLKIGTSRWTNSISFSLREVNNEPLELVKFLVYMDSELLWRLHLKAVRNKFRSSVYVWRI